jgi:hypothetical protein
MAGSSSSSLKRLNLNESVPEAMELGWNGLLLVVMGAVEALQWGGQGVWLTGPRDSGHPDESPSPLVDGWASLSDSQSGLPEV